MIKTAVDLEIFRPVTVETPQKHAHTQPRHIDCRHIRPHTFVGGRCTSYDFGLQQLLQDLSRKAYWYAIRRRYLMSGERSLSPYKTLYDDRNNHQHDKIFISTADIFYVFIEIEFFDVLGRIRKNRPEKANEPRNPHP